MAIFGHVRSIEKKDDFWTPFFGLKKRVLHRIIPKFIFLWEKIVKKRQKSPIFMLGGTPKTRFFLINAIFRKIPLTI